MNQNKILRTLFFIISNVAYLLVFLVICALIGFSKNVLMLINGIFFVLYILNLWKTGIDTFEFYDKRYFMTDMLSIAIYACIPSLFIRDLSSKEFVCISLIIISINESICVFWDWLCYHKSPNDQGKRFHFKWTIYTFLGILLNIVLTAVIISFDKMNQLFYLIILDAIGILYQIMMLVSWRISEWKLSKK